jgi:hypothetical protein
VDQYVEVEVEIVDVAAGAYIVISPIVSDASANIGIK